MIKRTKSSRKVRKKIEILKHRQWLKNLKRKRSNTQMKWLK